MSAVAPSAPASTTTAAPAAPLISSLLSTAEWLVTESGFDPARANTWETLFTVGNGRLGTRGTLEEGHRGQLSGTYLSGVYDAYDAAVVDLVNVTDWLDLRVEVAGTELEVQGCEVVEHERSLDLRRGLLWRRTVFADRTGRRTQLETLRFASMADRDLCVLRIEITALNHDGSVVISTGLDGHRRNLDRLPVYTDGTVFDPEVTWQKWALSRHLEERRRSADASGIYLELRTIDRGTDIGFATCTTSPAVPADQIHVEQRYEQIRQRFETELSQGVPLRLDKFVSVATSQETDDVENRCRERLAGHLAAGFDAALDAHRRRWAELWEASDCEIVGDPAAARAVRFGIYHLLIAVNPDDPTVNIGAKSLTGEGYRGHVFWDTEALMLPFFVFTQPESARTLLGYRHHTLPAARVLARESGCRGARYPWESADTGDEECPMWTNDGQFRFWTRDEEIHVSADVAYGILTYVDATQDLAFLLERGAEILAETSRFWVDRAAENADGSFSIQQVMGPDEFHSHVDDNAFTNVLVRWALRRAAEVHERLSAEGSGGYAGLVARLGLTEQEVERWRAVADRLVVSEPTEHDGVIEQFAGYFDRLDVPITSWDANDMPRYPDGYHHFNCDDTMLLKQPDVVMLMHLLPDEYDQATKRANFEFYEARTLHKSSLSPAIHAIIGLEVGDDTRALQYFARSAYVDLADNQGNTREGVHIASAAGSWQVVVFGFAGFRVRHDILTFTPRLPEQWQRVRFRLCWRGLGLLVEVGHQHARFRLEAEPDQRLVIEVAGRVVELIGGEEQTVGLTVPEPPRVHTSYSGRN